MSILETIGLVAVMAIIFWILWLPIGALMDREERRWRR